MSIAPTQALAFRCTKVKSPRGAQVSELTWADGHVSVLPHEILRGYCPCASCQGHEGPIKFVNPGTHQLEIDRIEPVGNYALCLVWFDGHQTGIYSYPYLRSLCQCVHCADNSPAARGQELARG